jgi:hypothetical protein
LEALQHLGVTAARTDWTSKNYMLTVQSPCPFNRFTPSFGELEYILYQVTFYLPAHCPCSSQLFRPIVGKKVKFSLDSQQTLRIHSRSNLCSAEEKTFPSVVGRSCG